MNKSAIALSVALATASFSSAAEIRINGFASIIGGQTLDSEDTLYGYDNDFDLENRSLFALQLSADLQENLTATAQIVGRGKNDFDAEFEWAYMTYNLSDSSQFSAGKMRIPFYRYSDFLDVGYAYRWIKPPQSVYNLSFSTYNGVSYLHNSTLGDWDSSAQFVFGSVDDDIVAITNSDAAQLDNTLGVNWTLSKDWFSARVAYFVTEASISAANSPELSSLLAGLNGYGLSEQANNIAIDEDDAYFAAVGFSVDYNDFLFDAEYTQFEVDNSILAEQQQYYASFGYRLDAWTLHLTYEHNEDKNGADEFNTVPLTINAANGATIPVTTDPSNANAPYLRSLVNGALNGVRSESETWSVGARYDFHPAAAFKVELNQFDNTLSNEKAELLSFGIDLVF